MVASLPAYDQVCQYWGGREAESVRHDPGMLQPWMTITPSYSPSPWHQDQDLPITNPALKPHWSHIIANVAKPIALWSRQCQHGESSDNKAIVWQWEKPNLNLAMHMTRQTQYQHITQWQGCPTLTHWGLGSLGEQSPTPIPKVLIIVQSVIIQVGESKNLRDFCLVAPNRQGEG